MNRIKQVAFVAAGLLAAGVGGLLVTGGSGPATANRAGMQPAHQAPVINARPGDSSTGGSVSDPGITVSGSGTVLGTPDTMRLSMGVSVTDADISAALTRANRHINAVTSALKDKGVKSEDVQTSGLNVNQSYGNNGKPDGYEVDEQIAVVLRDLSKAGSAISAAVDAGGNEVRVNGLNVDLQDSSALVAKAREQAFADAKTKAEQYASLAGRTLGKVTSLNEQVSSQPTPIFAGALADQARAGSAAQAVPVSPGQTSVDVSVTVVWAFA